MIEAYYWLIFFGVLILGDIAVVPAIYLSINGNLNLATIVFITFFSNIISDAIWYFIGTKIPKEKVFSLKMFRKHSFWLNKFSSEFETKGLKILTYSKFIYGIRQVVRILCGTYRLPFSKYMAINVFTTTTWLALISGLALFFKSSVGALETAVGNTEVALTLFVLTIALFDFWLKDWLKDFVGKKLSNSHNSKNSNPSSDRNI